MKTTTNTTTITTERGTVVKMTTTSTRSFDMVKEVNFCDGDNVEIEKGKETNTDTTILTVNGKDYKGYFTTKMTSDVLKGCFGVFLAGSQPIGLSQAKYTELVDLVNATKKEAETDESWVAYQTRQESNYKMNAEYDAHVKAINNMMTLNNKTY